MKTTKEIANPFLYQGYVSPKYFCDREEETRCMVSHLRNGRNVTLVSPRRIGKTGLVKNTFYHLQASDDNTVCLYLDIFATKTLRDFVEQLGAAVIEGLVRKNHSFVEKAAIFFSSLRPVFSLDPLTGAPSVSITVEPQQEELSMKRIFDFLGESDKEIYVAIDEFQQIAEYPESGTEALLRSYIQFTPHVHFIFSGSKFHLMTEIFASPKHPFYQSTEMMNLLPLRPEVYYPFCKHFFEQKGGDLSEAIFRKVYDEFEGHTWYVQCVMNRLYETATVADGEQLVREAYLSILQGRIPQYEGLTQFLTDNQFSLLKAIARDGLVAQPTSGKFIKAHRLNGASSVKAALKVLEDKELVYRTPQGYTVYDRFMEMWLRR